MHANRVLAKSRDELEEVVTQLTTAILFTSLISEDMELSHYDRPGQKND